MAGPFDDLGGHDRGLHLLEDVHHLLQAGRSGVDHVVGQDDGEGLIADQVAGHEHGVAQAHGFLLADVGEAHHVRDLAAHGEQIGLAAFFEGALELVADVEVVFDGRLAAAGDDDDLIAAGGQRLFDAVLDDGLVDQRQHFFGNGFGGRQKTCAESRSRKNCLAHFRVGGHFFNVRFLPRAGLYHEPGILQRDSDRMRPFSTTLASRHRAGPCAQF